MEIDKNLVKNIFIYLAKFGGMIKTLTKYIVKMVEYIYIYIKSTVRFNNFTDKNFYCYLH